MILYFSATGNSLAVARQLAERLNERLMLLTDTHQDIRLRRPVCALFVTGN